MTHDFYAKRLIHPVYVISVATMLTMRLILPFGSSHAAVDRSLDYGILPSDIRLTLSMQFFCQFWANSR
jgi:hypothetical protein